MEVSKELLSEVLGEDVGIGTYIKADVDEDELVQYTMRIEIYGNKVSYWRYYKEWDDGITMVKCNVNIYELAHRCKEWAFSKGYSISIHQSEISGYIAEIQCGWSVADFHSRFEPEVTIKACEWILKEINEKQLQH